MHATLSLEDHPLFVLMKQCLGVCNKGTAFRFEVTENAIANILRSWLPVMAQTLKMIIKGPTRKAVLRKMPKCFKRKYRQCQCIIDCPEIFIESYRLTTDKVKL